MGVGGGEQMGEAEAGAEVGRAHVDGEHQVEPLHRRRECSGEEDRAGVVDQDVDAAELGDGRRHRRLDLRLVAQVGGEGQGAAAVGFDLGGGGVDRAGQPGMGFGRLGEDRHVRAVARRPPGDRQPDAAAAAGHHQSLALECHRFPLYAVRFHRAG